MNFFTNIRAKIHENERADNANRQIKPSKPPITGGLAVKYANAFDGAVMVRKSVEKMREELETYQPGGETKIEEIAKTLSRYGKGWINYCKDDPILVLDVLKTAALLARKIPLANVDEKFSAAFELRETAYGIEIAFNNDPYRKQLTEALKQKGIETPKEDEMKKIIGAEETTSTSNALRNYVVSFTVLRASNAKMTPERYATGIESAHQFVLYFLGSNNYDFLRQGSYLLKEMGAGSGITNIYE